MKYETDVLGGSRYAVSGEFAQPLYCRYVRTERKRKTNMAFNQKRSNLRLGKLNLCDAKFVANNTIEKISIQS